MGHPGHSCQADACHCAAVAVRRAGVGFAGGAEEMMTALGYMKGDAGVWTKGASGGAAPQVIER